jgi:DNA-directed RNA polymerase I subunit RPA1
MALEIDSVHFSCMDSERIRRLSVVQVSLPDVVDNLNRPISGGLYDPAMGPIDRQSRCTTCSLSYKECPGHMGHIELPVPVYNPLLFKDLYRVLRSKCFMCHHLKVKDDAPVYIAKLQLIDAGRVQQALELDSGPKHHAAGDGDGEDTADADAASRTRVLRGADKLAARRARQLSSPQAEARRPRRVFPEPAR